MALRCYTVIKSGDCKVTVEIGRSSSATVLIFSTSFVVAVPHCVVMKLSITPEFHRALLERSSIVLGLGFIIYYCLYIIFTVSPVRRSKELRGDPY